jgi:phosphoglucosamine mutase
MTRKLFGTDGVRGRANEYPITAEVALQLGRAIAYIAQRGEHRHRILIGKDTRISGYMLEFAIASGVCSLGVDAMLLGPMPTPAVAFLVKSMRADAGIMLTASHNPYEDNGIKFFGADGFKLADDIEAELEGLLESGEAQQRRPTASAIGKTRRLEDAPGRYVQFVKTVLDSTLRLDGLRIVIDCAHGAAYRVAPAIFEELGAEVIAVGTAPDGKNINDSCGAVFPEQVCRLVKQYRADIGLALDGDADRLIVADDQGNIVDGDAVMAICGRALAKQELLANNTVVCTVMSNVGLERSLANVGVQVARTAVGDRYVVERMRADGFNFGGEQSGHLIFLDHASTGDGCVAALMLLDVMVRQGRKLSELRKVFERTPQKLVNVVVSQKPPLETLPRVSKRIEQVQKDLGKDGRVLVRYSGTENKARVMVECLDEARASALASELGDALREEIAATHLG